MVELCSHSATERAGMETLHLRMRAPMPHPTRDGLRMRQYVNSVSLERAPFTADGSCGRKRV